MENLFLKIIHFMPFYISILYIYLIIQGFSGQLLGGIFLIHNRKFERENMKYYA